MLAWLEDLLLGTPVSQAATASALVAIAWISWRQYRDRARRRYYRQRERARREYWGWD